MEKKKKKSDIYCSLSKKLNEKCYSFFGVYVLFIQSRITPTTFSFKKIKLFVECV